MTDADQVAAKLAEIRERSERVIRAACSIQPGREFADACIASSGDVPVLLAVVDAALAYHEPHTSHGQPECISCIDAAGEGVDWPCAEYQDISCALLGEEATDAG